MEANKGALAENSWMKQAEEEEKYYQWLDRAHEGEAGEAEWEAWCEAFKFVQDQFLPVLYEVMEIVESFLRTENAIKDFRGDVDKFVRKWLGEFIY